MIIHHRLILLNKLLQDGNTLYKKTNFNDASIRYSYAIKRVSPSSDEPHFKLFSQLKLHLMLNLINCKMKLEDQSSAISLSTEVLLHYPECHMAYQARARAYQSTGALEKAVDDLSQALRLSPYDREICASLIKIKEQRREQEALEKFSAAFAQNDNFEETTKGR